MNKKRGFSIIEAVIALAVIVIVTTSALSLVLSSIARKAEAAKQSTAQDFAEDVWECFKAADEYSEFTSNFNFAIGDGLSEGETNGDGEMLYTYSSENMDFDADILVRYANGERATFEISVTNTDGDNTKEFVSFSYVKGDSQ